MASVIRGTAVWAPETVVLDFLENVWCANRSRTISSRYASRSQPELVRTVYATTNRTGSTHLLSTPVSSAWGSADTTSNLYTFFKCLTDDASLRNAGSPRRTTTPRRSRGTAGIFSAGARI